MNGATGVGEAAGPLRLVGLQQAGLAFDFEWRWPCGGRVQWLHDVLREAATAGPARREGLAAFSLSLRCTGQDDTALWCLSNHTGPLSCAVNRVPLLSGCDRTLQCGDEIEVGLIRLRVHIESMPNAAAASQADPPAQVAPEHTADRFDLATLDVEPAPDTPGDFIDLIASVPWHLVEAQAGVDAPVAQTPDPLEALHAQYLEKLRNPLHVEEGTAWQDLLHGDRAALANPLQHWMQIAGTQTSVEEVLGQPSDIDAVMAQLDALGDSDVLAPPPFDNVLRLFAPDGVRHPGPRGIGQALPSLTRREHHSLAPDSAVPLFQPTHPTHHAQEPSST
jgi:predicted component of type VI protein secretion system